MTWFAIFVAFAALTANPVAAQSDRQRICQPGFAAAGRPDEATWERLKRAAAARAHIPWSQRGKYELDHIVPRCLDGPNTLDNLQMQPCYEWAGYRCVAGPAADKDEREAHACRAYCAGELALDEARAQFRREWP